MDDVQVGRRFRALRQRRNWRQEDLAQRAGVSRSLISLVERGRIERVTFGSLRRIARELEAEFPAQLWWRGGDLDRLMDEGHAALVGRIAELLEQEAWEVRFEVSYSVYGERGSIDVLAWHPEARMLLVVEVKTDLVVVEETLRKHDAKARLASKVAAEQLGWTAMAVARLLVLPSRSTPRRRVERHATVMTTAYPSRGEAVRSWLRDPAGPVSGLLFLEAAARKGGSGTSSVTPKRVRARRPLAA